MVSMMFAKDKANRNSETDIDNVLQTHTIFVNVSKGQTASEEDKDKVFGTKENDKIITEVIINTISKSALGYVDGVPAARHWLIPLKILCKKCIDLHLTILFDISTEMSKILAKGELQVSEKERSSAHEKILKEIALTIAQKCINPDTKRPYTVTMIEKAMNDIHFSVNPTKSAKLQALEIIKTLQAEYKDFKIQRAKMKIRIKAPSKEGKLIKEKIKDEAEELQDEFQDGRLELVSHSLIVT